MADIAVGKVTKAQPGSDVIGQVGGEAATATQPATQRITSTSKYDGVRTGRKVTANPQLELKAPAGINGKSKPACDMFFPWYCM